MKTGIERLDNALFKLYTAFHNDKLRHGDCTACAVGNMLDNQLNWYYFVSESKIYDPIKAANQVRKSGYSPKQIVEIERLFEKSNGDQKHYKENQFRGLCAVVEYLCELDNVPNVMDYTKLFEYEKDDTPKYELQN